MYPNIVVIRIGAVNIRLFVHSGHWALGNLNFGKIPSHKCDLAELYWGIGKVVKTADA